MPKDSKPLAAAGNFNQVLLVGLESVTTGVPVLAESVDPLLAAVPFCTTEKASDVGENDKVLGNVTVRVTLRVALV